MGKSILKTDKFCFDKKEKEDVHMITHKQRIEAALEGKILDRPAYAMWGPHFNLEDRNVKDFTDATIRYQEAYDFDFIKVMPNGIYFTEDFGQVIRPAENYLDDTWMNTLQFAIKDPHDWAKIKVPDLKKGALAREIEVVKRLCDHYQGDVPVLPTIFSNIVWMGEMTAGHYHQEVIVSQFKQSEKYAKMGMEVVAETNERLMEAFVDAGADGFFLGYQMGMYEKMGKEMYEECAAKYDLRNLNAIKDKTWFNLAHLCHGDRNDTDQFMDYPVQAFNWADTHKEHRTLREMREITDKVLIGGLDHDLGSSGYLSIGDGSVAPGTTDLSGSDREKVKQVIRRRLEEGMKAAGPKFVLSGGCGWNHDALHRFPLVREVIDEVADEIAKGKNFYE